MTAGIAESSWRVFSTSHAPAEAGEVTVVPAAARATETEVDPAGYVPDDGLADAVDVALALGQPLLVTGDPGTGKTQLAYSIAYRLFGRGAVPIVFNTKTTSAARDLFYNYDALQHFRDAQIGKQDGNGASQRPAGTSSAKQYITYQGLGLAILLANPLDRVKDTLPNLPSAWRARRSEMPEPRQSVVLIDEIDKAPRDLPNDLLNEIERMSFEVKETGDHFVADEKYRPIVVLTSNSEKLLPDPFLRRCTFYHLEFPKGKQLQDIVALRMRRSVATDGWIAKAVQRFEEIRGQLRRKPATAELLAWLRVLEQLEREAGGANPLEHPKLDSTLAVLAKTREDRNRLQKTS